MALILEGAKVAELKKQELAQEIALFPHVRKPHLHVIAVGEDPASKVYIRNKIKACESCGIVSSTCLLPENITEETVLDAIEAANKDTSIDGILLQLPLPKHLHAEKLLSAIAPTKDVDGIHPYNLGRLVQGDPLFTPCTPTGIRTLLEYYTLPIAGKHIVVLGRSVIVGKTMALLALLPGVYGDATVTVCHSRTRGLENFTRRADILIVAMGKPQFVKESMVAKDCVVIDVGINRTENGLVGDCDFSTMVHKVQAITPVPKGVGPMTVYSLLLNTVMAWKVSLKL